MKIRILGAGPAGLYFAALMKRLDPSHDIAIFDRNPRDATWGFGVVFSDRALEFLRADDEALYRYLTPHLENWPDITIVHNDTAIPIAGNGFASIGRLELLTLLYDYVERLGVKMHFDTEITTVGSDGRSRSGRRSERSIFVDPQRERAQVRHHDRLAPEQIHLVRQHQGVRQPDSDVSARRISACSAPTITVTNPTAAPSWSRSKRHLEARRIRVHEPRRHDPLLRASLRKDLDGHRIISNNSYWRNFPAIWNERWSFDNVVLLGDALRTAHFSIGSGTRLAMEDSVALFKAFREIGAKDVPARWRGSSSSACRR